MKYRSLLLMAAMLITLPSVATGNLDSLLLQLDHAIYGYETFTHQKENKIRQIKNKLSRTTADSNDLYEINKQLYHEYQAFICDSAIHYLNENIKLADNWRDKDKGNEARLELSYLLASSGMYKESVDLLETVERATLRPELLNQYYECFNRVYGEMAHYTQDEVASNRYWRISQTYRDSLHNHLPAGSDELLLLQEIFLRDNEKFEEALLVNDERLKGINFGTPEFALITYYRSVIFKEKGDLDNEKYYLALSAISDIQSAIKDHASLWMLAEQLYNEGEIERAYRYMRFSWNETKFFNARLRSWQSADVLSLIDKTYQAMIERQNERLERYAFVITFLVLLLLVALIYIYRQVNKLSVARNSLQDANVKLNCLNDELKQMNICLQTTNLDLSESNQIKEEYIARFVKLCSTYIDKLDAYRRMVNKKITAGEIKELQKITRSQEALDKELGELYANFDSAFLHIFPDFVSKFNILLAEDEQIILKRDELLNTELRIFALIRLGIVDSSQIAEFLRYSVNTIYNYRSKVKNKAKGSRDDFEEEVKRIR